MIRVALLPGDGVGAEVLDGPARLLRTLPGVEVTGPWPVGATAAAAGGSPLPPETLAACDAADAILLGAVGEDPDVPSEACPRPEVALHELRRRYDLRVSIREVPLGESDLVVVRNLRGGSYAGEAGVDGDEAFDVVRLDAARIAEIVGTACDLLPAGTPLVSVDKANLTATGRLWRRVAGEVAAARGAPVEHRYVDRAGFELAAGAAVPAVIATEGLFGDVLSDVAAGRAGSPALCGSASVRPARQPKRECLHGGHADTERPHGGHAGITGTRCQGLFEPAHGSAPRRARRGQVNPVGGFLALVALLEWFPSTRAAGARLRAAVRTVLRSGPWTYDLAPPGAAPAPTAAVADAVLAAAAAPPGSVDGRPGDTDTDHSRVPAARLEEWSAQVLAAVGVTRPHAAAAARVLSYADLAGIDSHGVARLPAYVAALRGGTIATAGAPTVSAEDGAVALVDGHDLLGHPVSELALDEAVARARRHGVGWVGVRRSSHHGAAGYYARRAADAGLVALALTNTGSVVAPAGTGTRFLGTNPLAFAMPVAGEDPLVLDMATSAVSGGKIELALRDRAPIPDGWALDAGGVPTRDPARVFPALGALLPLGSHAERSAHKGYALGLMVELLTSVLAGGPAGPDVGNLTFRAVPGPAAGGRACELTVPRGNPAIPDGERRRGAGVSHLFVVLDPVRLGDPAAPALRAADLLHRLRTLPPLDPARPVRTPGQRSSRETRRRRADGIPLHPAVRARLDELGAAVGLPLTEAADA